MSMKIELRRTVHVHLDSHFLSTSFWAVMTGPFHGLSRWLEGADPNGQNSPWFIIKRPRIWDYRWLHSSIPFSAKKKKKRKRNLFNPPLWCSFGGRPGTAGIHHRPKKSTEHTEPGGALAPACREEGQLAGEQEVLGLIGQRETPLGRRSQRSVGTSLARRLACGALMENGRGGAGSSVLTLDSELQPNAAGLSFQPRPRRLWQPWLTALRAAYLTQSHPPSLFWRISSSGHSQII